MVFNSVWRFLQDSAPLLLPGRGRPVETYAAKASSSSKMKLSFAFIILAVTSFQLEKLHVPLNPGRSCFAPGRDYISHLAIGGGARYCPGVPRMYYTHFNVYACILYVFSYFVYWNIDRLRNKWL